MNRSALRRLEALEQQAPKDTGKWHTIMVASDDEEQETAALKASLTWTEGDNLMVIRLVAVERGEVAQRAGQRCPRRAHRTTGLGLVCLQTRWRDEGAEGWLTLRVGHSDRSGSKLRQDGRRDDTCDEGECCNGEPHPSIDSHQILARHAKPLGY